MLYTGTLSVTVSGAKCLPWNSEKAKEVLHGKHIDSEVKLLENYCRNPDGDDEGVWCVTDEPPNFEYCDLHYCGEKPALVWVGTLVRQWQTRVKCLAWEAWTRKHAHHACGSPVCPNITHTNLPYTCRAVTSLRCSLLPENSQWWTRSIKKSSGFKTSFLHQTHCVSKETFTLLIIMETAARPFIMFVFLSLSDSLLEDENEQSEGISGRTTLPQEFKTFFDDKTFGSGEAGEQKL